MMSTISSLQMNGQDGSNGLDIFTPIAASALASSLIANTIANAALSNSTINSAKIILTNGRVSILETNMIQLQTNVSLLKLN
jgi:hypothetical protein